MQSALAPPPSRRDVRRESRREAIVDTARQSFLKHGYAGTTMSGIAATLGGSKGTLWNHFASKDVLFAAVLDRVTQDFRQELSLILNPEDPIRTTLTRYCRQFLQKITSPEGVALYRLVIAEASRFPELGGIFYRRGPEMIGLQLSEFLARAMAQGQLRKSDAQVAARQLTGLCFSGCHMALLVGATPEATPQQLEQDVTGATDTFLRAYAPL